MNGNMEFRRARREEAEEILQLYLSLIHISEPTRH